MADLLDWNADKAGDVALDAEETGAIEEAAAEIETGGLDSELDIGAVKRRIANTLMRRAPRMSPMKRAYVTAKLSQQWAERQFLNANRMVPLENQTATAAGAIITFTYEPPDKGRFLGLMMSAAMAAVWSTSELTFGTFRVVEPSGLTGSVASPGASSAMWQPEMQRVGIAFGTKLMTMIDKNTQMTLRFKNSTAVGVTGFVAHANFYCPGVGLSGS